MKINAKISILVNRESTTIEVYDEDAEITFLELTLTPEQLSSALSRMSQTDVQKAEIIGLHNVGKIRERKELVIPLDGTDWHNRKEKAIEIGNKICPEGWIMRESFNSQNSFFRADGKEYARAQITRWVEKQETL